MSYLPKDYVVNYYSKDFSIEADRVSNSYYDIVIKDSEGTELKREKGVYSSDLAVKIDDYKWKMLINPSTVNMPYPGQPYKPKKSSIQPKRRRK